MVYSLDCLNDLKKFKKKEKLKTAGVLLLTAVILAFLIFIIFKFKLPYLSIVGGIITFAAFVFWNMRANFIHKKIKNYIDFYSDILYGDRERDLVSFCGEPIKVKNGDFDFYELGCFSYKTETKDKILIDCDFDFSFRENARYEIRKVGNVLVEYDIKDEIDESGDLLTENKEND